MSEHEHYENHEEPISSSTHDEHHDNNEQYNETNNHQNEPSAPPATDDYILVQDNNHTATIDSAVDRVLDVLTGKQEEISNSLDDFITNTEANLNQHLLLNQHKTVVAEADSSAANHEQKLSDKSHEVNKEQTTDKKKACSGSNASSLCPYYLLACDYLTRVEVPPRVRDLLLWKCPKTTGAVFGSSFVLLLSLSLFSLLTVVSSLMLLGLTAVGAYRFYLALVFRIKGTHDETFDKLSKFNLSLPKDKIQELARLLETDLNVVLNKAKSIILWDNVMTSVKAFVTFYLVNLVGSCFNTLTLLLLGLVSLFTLPKVYEVYKKPIDQAIEKGTAAAHQMVKQVMVKIPMLNKKKTQ